MKEHRLGLVLSKAATVYKMVKDKLMEFQESVTEKKADQNQERLGRASKKRV